jgi:hypothetical protein
MRRLLVVFGGVPVLGRIAASDVTASEAKPEMNPRVAGLHAVFANMFIGLLYVDLVQVSAFTCHRPPYCTLLDAARGRNDSSRV